MSAFQAWFFIFWLLTFEVKRKSIRWTILTYLYSLKPTSAALQANCIAWPHLPRNPINCSSIDTCLPVVQSFRSNSKISSQWIWLFTSIRDLRVSKFFLSFNGLEILQISLDLLPSLTTHAIDDQGMSRTLCLGIPIVFHTTHDIKSYIEQNSQK